MTLFSWFIKKNKDSTPKQRFNQGVVATLQKNELNSAQVEMQATILANELNTFNNNTMWPIAKVKKATMIIKKPKEYVAIPPIKVVKAKKINTG